MNKKSANRKAYWIFVGINLLWLAVLLWDQPTGARKWIYLAINLLNLTIFTRMALKRE